MKTLTARSAPDDDGLTGEGFAKIGEAAEFLGVSRAMVYALMERGELVYAKFGRSRRIPRRALVRYAEGAIVGA